MTQRPATFVCAVVGNTTLQVALFDTNHVRSGQGLPRSQDCHVFGVDDVLQPIELPQAYTQQDWYVASVNRSIAKALRSYAQGALQARSLTLLSNDQFPIACRVADRSRVGADRLAAAVAALHFRESHCPMVVIDAGTALTINAISTDGEFLGGAILPGLRSSLRALATQTDQLPLVELDLSTPYSLPEPIGADTESAIQAGVFWGLVGAARELVARFAVQLGAPPTIMVTGGMGPWLARELGADAICEPQLVLSGIALTALGYANKRAPWR